MTQGADCVRPMSAQWVASRLEREASNAISNARWATDEEEMYDRGWAEGMLHAAERIRDWAAQYDGQVSP